MSVDNDRMIVTLTVGELRALIREEVQRALAERRGGAAAGPARSYIGPEELAKHFGVSRGTVHNWVRTGGCPHEVRGKIVRFKLSDVEAWFAAGKPRP